MSTPASSIPAAIRDRISAPAQPRVWTPEDFADLGPRTAVDQALHRLVASEAYGGLHAASTTPPRTTGSPESPPTPTRAT
jgi:hypothetical protein